MLQFRTRGEWWDILAESRLTLFATREYEHLVMAMSVVNHMPRMSYFPLPHPSGLVVNGRTNVVHIASTRNPNIVFDLAPACSTSSPAICDHQPMAVPLRARYYPGRMYLHDLALIRDQLYANAVGHNSVVLLNDDGSWKHAWWPRAIDRQNGPAFERNHLQLNSIAAGKDLRSSFFSASTDRITRAKPGDKRFSVDRRGVIFSGRSREPIARGLTRPHSARLMDGTIWLDDSGYGEFGRVEDGAFRTVAALPGWTRGLAFAGNVAFVGTSHVLPRFSHYAPGLRRRKTECAVHAIDLRSGAILGSVIWPNGNQIFAIDCVPVSVMVGFPFLVSSGQRHTIPFFYEYELTSASQDRFDKT